MYLDSSYTQEWIGETFPDLDNLDWKLKENGWYDATLTTYLYNTGQHPLTVKSTVAENPDVIVPGFSVGSETYKLKPEERIPMAIELSIADWYSGNPMIWFQILPDTSTTEGDNAWLIIIPTLLAVVGLSAWVLHRKGQSYWWLLLALGWIGFIAVLSLSNKRALKEGINNDGLTL